MKKLTGIFFIATALFLLGTSFKPLADDFPRLTKLEAPIQKFADDFPRLTKIEEPIKTFADDFPRLT
ncbi:MULTISPECIES: hypothetical protein [unclassified Exiguobacterium]|uniref:hypothetical protein n=1 Tax=unclassified Exiguobacterium TaxID=2644629 RepID=UPI001BEC62EA|nr:MULTISPECIES: hypothetical protein [unclassified Exiguobacterium]